MVPTYISRLEFLIQTIPDKLFAISDGEFSNKISPFKWSKMEILGHLIDSATNNHQRFVRAKFEVQPVIAYDQEKWNQFSRYASMDGKHLIEFWTVYNRHILLLWQNSTENEMQQLCDTGSGKPLSLIYLAEDYVQHLEHHLRQIVTY